MNRIIRPLSILAFSCLITTGCVWLKNSDNQARLVTLVATRAGDVAKFATLADLKDNPGHRPAYEAAVQSLDALIQSPTYNSSSLEEILARLPIKEFKGPNGTLMLKGGLIIFDAITMLWYDPASVPAITQFANRVRDGIALALETEIPASVRLERGVRPAVVKPVYRETERPPAKDIIKI